MDNLTALREMALRRCAERVNLLTESARIKKHGDYHTEDVYKRQSRLILILLMFFGRVGGLTLVFAALPGVHKNVSRFPKEKITVG